MKLDNVFRFNELEQYEIDIEINSKELKDVQEHINYYKQFENYNFSEITERENGWLLKVNFVM